MTTVDKKIDLSRKEFIEKYEKTGTPVILENVTKIWKSNISFTPDFFKEQFGNIVTQHGGREYTMTEIMEITAKSTKENPAPYPIKFNLLTQLKDILPLMHPLNFNLARPNWLNSRFYPKNKMANSIDLFIGGPGNHYSIHKDAYDVHAWLIQLYGEKDIIVFPREQENLMYAGNSGINLSRSPISIVNPDYEKYPKFKEATPIKVTLKAGDAIYIPNGIWHTTMANQHNISIIVDQVNSSNFRAWRKDIYEYKREHNKLRASLDYFAAVAIASICKIGELFGVKY